MNSLLGDPQFLLAVLAIVAGVLILVAPKVLNYVVAAYLIIIGVIQLLRYLS